MAKRLPKTDPFPAGMPASDTGTAPLTEKAKKPRLKAVALPGLENMRIQELDDVCSTIAGVRETLNEARQEEAEHLQTALSLMRSHRKQTWQSAGVELVRVPGQEKLRARTVKAKATAEMGDIDTVEVPF